MYSVYIFIYIFLLYGISNIVVFANGPFHIFKCIRENASKIHPHLEEVLTCMICFPTWVGMSLSVLDTLFSKHPHTPFNILLGEYGWFIRMVFDGLFASGIVWFIHTIQEYFEVKEEEEIFEENE